MTQQQKINKIRDLHEFFLKKFRPKKLVILRFSDKMVWHGSYVYNNNKHYITLNKKDNYDVIIDTIQHEWLHLLDNNKKEYSDERMDHSDNWASKFGKVYRTYLEWTEKIY